MLASHFTGNFIEAGCDEAGRGCLAGPVFAAAVVLPLNFKSRTLDDSKKLSAKVRTELRLQIEQEALSWAVASVDPAGIDEINILNASILAMHKAISSLDIRPELLLIDGNRFTTFEGIPHRCFVKGDGRFMSIAAASVLAKTHRDEYMVRLHQSFPQYDWLHNKGYPVPKHREAIARYGITDHHRKSFALHEQLRLFF